jgi:hypothetical protein
LSQNLQLKIEKVSKKSQTCSKAASDLPFSNSCMRRDRSRLQCMSEFPSWLKHIQKSRVVEMVASGFLLTEGDYG